MSWPAVSICAGLVAFHSIFAAVLWLLGSQGSSHLVVYHIKACIVFAVL